MIQNIREANELLKLAECSIKCGNFDYYRTVSGEAYSSFLNAYKSAETLEEKDKIVGLMDMLINTDLVLALNGAVDFREANP